MERIDEIMRSMGIAPKKENSLEIIEVSKELGLLDGQQEVLNINDWE
jgi:hypothetical protein